MKDSKKFSLKRILRHKSDEEIEPSYVSPVFLILPEEKVIFKTHPHWLFVVVPEVAFAIFGTLVIKYMPVFFVEQTLLAQVITVLFVSAWSFVMTILLLDWLCTNYYLTNLRLVEERGIIGKRIMSIWLDKVQDVTCKFGILGRIFGFGDIEIESAGTYGKIVFGNLPMPLKLQEEIEKAMPGFQRHRF